MLSCSPLFAKRLGWMAEALQLTPQTVHIWRTSLVEMSTQEEALFALLSADERARAERFIYPLHKRRFIAARGVLRLILSLYLALAPEKIIFSYAARGKPFLADNVLQFNVSHSAEMAVYAFTLEAAIGIDIEKVEKEFKEALAARYFSASENASLLALPEAQRSRSFYRLWARKEAILKATGDGLHIPLNSFSVGLKEQETVLFSDQTQWYLQSFQANPHYEAALATPFPPQQLIFYEYTKHGDKHKIE